MDVNVDINIKTDCWLWDRFREGDEQAYTALMTKYTRPMFNYGYRLCQDRDFLKDCIQEIFLELWNKHHLINATPSVKWYLFKALRLRIFRNQSNWNKNEQLNDDYHFMVEFSVESKLIDEATLAKMAGKIKNILNNLPPRQREIIFLRFYENLDFDQISEIMGINRQSVHNLLQKAYKNFRAEWTIVILMCHSILFN